jgi:hypothetical protein
MWIRIDIVQLVATQIWILQGITTVFLFLRVLVWYNKISLCFKATLTHSHSQQSTVNSQQEEWLSIVSIALRRVSCRSAESNESKTHAAATGTTRNESIIQVVALLISDSFDTIHRKMYNVVPYHCDDCDAKTDTFESRIIEVLFLLPTDEHRRIFVCRYR